MSFINISSLTIHLFKEPSVTLVSPSIEYQGLIGVRCVLIDDIDTEVSDRWTKHTMPEPQTRRVVALCCQTWRAFHTSYLVGVGRRINCHIPTI